MNKKHKTVQIVDDNVSILVEVLSSENIMNGDYLEKVSSEQDFFNFDEILKGINGLSRKLKESIDEAKPSEATVEFDIGVEVKEGKLLATLCGAHMKGNFKIILKWN